MWALTRLETAIFVAVLGMASVATWMSVGV
jgi:hypothetical protein